MNNQPTPAPMPPAKKHKLSNLSNLILKIMLGIFAFVCLCAIIAILFTGLSDSTGRLLGVSFYIILFGGLCFCCSLICDHAKHPAPKFLGIAGMILHIVVGAATSIILILGPGVFGYNSYQHCYGSSYSYNRTVDSTTNTPAQYCYTEDVSYYDVANTSLLETYFFALFAILFITLFLLIQNRHTGTTIVRNSTITAIALFAAIWAIWSWIYNFTHGDAFFNEMVSRILIVLGILASLGAVASIIMNHIYRSTKKFVRPKMIVQPYYPPQQPYPPYPPQPMPPVPPAPSADGEDKPTPSKKSP